MLVHVLDKTLEGKVCLLVPAAQHLPTGRKQRSPKLDAPYLTGMRMYCSLFHGNGYAVWVWRSVLSGATQQHQHSLHP
jgi:hypothetical protein